MSLRQLFNLTLLTAAMAQDLGEVDTIPPPMIPRNTESCIVPEAIEFVWEDIKNANWHTIADLYF